MNFMRQRRFSRFIFFVWNAQSRIIEIKDVSEPTQLKRYMNKNEIRQQQIPYKLGWTKTKKKYRIQDKLNRGGTHKLKNQRLTTNGASQLSNSYLVQTYKEMVG